MGNNIGSFLQNSVRQLGGTYSNQPSNNIGSWLSQMNTQPIKQGYNFSEPPNVGGFGAPEKLPGGGYRTYNNRTGTFSYGGQPTGGYAQNSGYQNMMQNLYGNAFTNSQNIGQRTTQQGSFNLGQIPFWRYLAQRMYQGK